MNTEHPLTKVEEIRDSVSLDLPAWISEFRCNPLPPPLEECAL